LSYWFRVQRKRQVDPRIVPQVFSRLTSRTLRQSSDAYSSSLLVLLKPPTWTSGLCHLTPAMTWWSDASRDGPRPKAILGSLIVPWRYCQRHSPELLAVS
jgi:hypothetical protein